MGGLNFKAHCDWKERWYPGEVVRQAVLAPKWQHMPTAVDATQVLRAAGGVSVCVGLPAVCDKFGLTVDQGDSEEVPGLVDEDGDSDTEEGAFGQLLIS